MATRAKTTRGGKTKSTRYRNTTGMTRRASATRGGRKKK